MIAELLNPPPPSLSLSEVLWAPCGCSCGSEMRQSCRPAITSRLQNYCAGPSRLTSTWVRVITTGNSLHSGSYSNFRHHSNSNFKKWLPLACLMTTMGRHNQFGHFNEEQLHWLRAYFPFRRGIFICTILDLLLSHLWQKRVYISPPGKSMK